MSAATAPANVQATQQRRLRRVCDLWPVPANETIALAIYFTFWIGLIVGSLIQAASDRGGW